MGMLRTINESEKMYVLFAVTNYLLAFAECLILNTNFGKIYIIFWWHPPLPPTDKPLKIPKGEITDNSIEKRSYFVSDIMVKFSLAEIRVVFVHSNPCYWS